MRSTAQRIDDVYKKVEGDVHERLSAAIKQYKLEHAAKEKELRGLGFQSGALANKGL